MNLSITALKMSRLLTNSPFIQISNRKFSLTTNLSNVNFQYSFSNFINCQHKSGNINIYSSLFNKFLKSSILIENMAIVKHEFTKGLPNIYDTSISCRDCIFTSCQDKHKGSAISSLSILILINCLFKNCKSEIGGAIFAQDRSDISSCSFFECSAFDDAGSAFISNVPRIKMQHTEFIQSKAPKTAAIFIEAQKSHLYYVNISECSSKTSNGVLFFKNTEAKNENLIISYDETDGDCAGIFAYKNKLITFVSSIFAQLYTDGKSFEYGAAFTAHDMQNDSMIYHSSFMSIMHSRGFVIASITPNDFHIFISETCLSSRESELQQFVVIYDSETTIIDRSCGTYLLFYIAKPLGFQSPQYKPKSLIQRLTSNWLFSILKIVVPIVYFMAFIFVFVAKFLFTQPNNKKRKRPKTQKNII